MGARAIAGLKRSHLKTSLFTCPRGRSIAVDLSKHEGVHRKAALHIFGRDARSSIETGGSSAMDGDNSRMCLDAVNGRQR